MAMLLRGPDAPVQLIVCADARYDLDPFLLRPAPILVPPLSARESELPLIVDGYARDAISTLDADATGSANADRTWVLDHAAGSLSEIEKATLRIVAIRKTGSIAQAAARLGMSHVALSQWIGRHRLSRRGDAPKGRQ